MEHARSSRAVLAYGALSNGRIRPLHGRSRSSILFAPMGDCANGMLLALEARHGSSILSSPTWNVAGEVKRDGLKTRCHRTFACSNHARSIARMAER